MKKNKVKESGKPLKIAVICDSFPKLSETFITQHVVSLIDEGHHVDVFSINRPEDKLVHPVVSEYSLLDKTFYCRRMPSNRFYKYLCGFWLFNLGLIKNSKLMFGSLNIFRFGAFSLNLRLLFLVSTFNGKAYDIVHVHFGLIALQVVHLLDVGGISGRLIVSFHGYDLNRKSIEQTENYYASLFERVDKMLVNSLFSRGRVLSLGAPERKISVLPIPVDLELFRPRYSTTTTTTTNNDCVRLLSVSRLSEEKGIIYSLAAVATYVKKFGSYIQYDIIGDGPLLSKLREFVSHHGLVDNVIFHLAQTQSTVIRLMSEVDIFVFPSIELPTGEVDTQGVVIQEAQAMALPVIASDVGGVKYGMMDGISGYLVDQKNSDVLVDCIRRLAVDSELRTRMGRAGRKYVTEKYSTLNIRQQLDCIYFEVL